MWIQNKRPKIWLSKECIIFINLDILEKEDSTSKSWVGNKLHKLFLGYHSITYKLCAMMCSPNNVI